MANDSKTEQAEAERKEAERKAREEQIRAQMQSKSRERSTETVTVACKLPNGLVLRAFEWEEFDEPMYGGGYRRQKRSVEVDSFTVRGPAHEQQKAPTVALQSGYALTPGVPKALWDNWIKHNAKTAMVINGLIFAHEKKANVIDEAKEKRNVKSGLERLDPAKLPKRLLMADEVKENVEAGLAQTAALEEQD